MHARDSEPIVRGWHTRPWSCRLLPHGFRTRGSQGHAWGAWEVAASRESVTDGRGVRWRGTGCSVVARGLGAIRVAREWYTRGGGGGGVDVVCGRGSENIGIFVVLRRHTRPHVYVVIERYMRSPGSVRRRSMHVASHAWGGMHRALERSQRAESERCVEKYRCILRIYAGPRAISGRGVCFAVTVR